MISNMIESRVEERKQEPEKPVNREKTCPFLLRIFCNNGYHNDLYEYRRGNVPPNELQAYTWMDATLKEITDLVLEVNPDAHRKGTIFDFSIVFPNLKQPEPRMRNIGQVTVGHKGFNDQKNLSQCTFVIGDFLDVAITSPGQFNRGQGQFNRGGFNRGGGQFNRGGFNRGSGQFNRGANYEY